MLKYVFFMVLASMVVIQYAHADRERVTSCPPAFEGETQAGSITHEGKNWGILLGGFTDAQILQGNQIRPAINCNYGHTSVGLEVPNTYTKNNCSFDKHSVQPKLMCKGLIPADCVVYCDKK